MKIIDINQIAYLYDDGEDPPCTFVQLRGCNHELMFDGEERKKLLEAFNTHDPNFPEYERVYISLD